MSSSHPRSLNRRRSLRWILFAPAATLAWFAPATVSADITNGLEYTVFDNRTGQFNQYNASPPIPPTTPIIAEGLSDNINYIWGGGPVLNATVSEDVVVRWTGWLLPPDDETYYMCAASDDGFRLILDEVTVIDDWYDRGGGCGQTADVDFSDGEPKELVAWYYENGGGAHAQLLYFTGSGWAIVPSSWFWITQPTPTSTTTTSSTTTVPETTTTTVPETTTTQQSTTTTVEERATTTLPPTTTTSTTQAPPPPPPPPPPAPTTTEQETTTTTVPETTTTTVLPETTTTTQLPPPRTTTTTQPLLPTTTVETSAPPQVTVAAPPPPTVMDVVGEATTDSPVASLVDDTIPAPAADAPIEERQEFEATVDIYSGGYEDYVPVGSKISVAERRAVVAATAVLFVLPAPVPVSRRMK